MISRFNDILMIVTLVQFLLFSIFLVTLKKGKPISNKFLALFLFSKSLAIVNYLLSESGIGSFHIFFILVPFSFLYGPTLYLHVKSLAYKNFALSKWDVLHLAPFVLCSLYFTWLYHLRSQAFKMAVIINTTSQVRIEQILIVSATHFLLLCYLIAAVFTLWRYRHELKKSYSFIERINLSWLNFVLYGFILIWIFDVVGFVLEMVSTPLLFLYSVTLALLFIFANIIVYKGLKQPELFNGIQRKPKYIYSKLTSSEKKKYMARLESYMKEEKPHLIPSLSINDLAEKLSISSRHLSQVINESLGKNFFDFINGYRIEEAKKLLNDSSDTKINILELLFDVGFNTKSVFNRVFKKQTGVTPTEYMKLQQD